MKRTIDPNKLKTRDPLILKIIGGATKANVAKDLKKEANKTAARGTKMNKTDRGQNQGQNGMQLAELQHLKKQLVTKDQLIKTLTAEVQELRGAANVKVIFDPTTPENVALATEAEKQ